MGIDYILASSVAKESCEALAMAITRKQGAPCESVHYARQRRLCVRYGSMVPSDDTASLNSLDAVQRAAHKFGALIALQDAGVSIPRLPLYDTGPYDYDVILRKLHRHGGNDEPPIFRKNSTVVWGEYDYALEYVKKIEEWRVHVCRGEVIRTQRKRRKREFTDDDGNGPHAYIWSLSRGWVLVDEPLEFTYPVWLAKRAVEVLGLDFGAVDIIRGPFNFYVIEVNTAPGITNNVEPYASAFLKWAKEVQNVC